MFTFKMYLQVQVYVDSLVKKAYDNWDQVVEYDGKSFLPDNGLDNQQQQSALPVTGPPEQQLNSGLQIGGKCCCSAKSCLMDCEHCPHLFFYFVICDGCSYLGSIPLPLDWFFLPTFQFYPPMYMHNRKCTCAVINIFVLNIFVYM